MKFDLKELGALVQGRLENIELKPSSEHCWVSRVCKVAVTLKNSK